MMGPCSAVGSESNCRSKGCEFYPSPVPFTFVEIDHEIISMVIFLPLIQEEMMSVTSESKHTKYWLTAQEICG